MGLIILIALGVLFLADVIVFSFEKYEWSIGIMVASIAAAYFFQPDIHTFVNAAWFTILTRYVPVYLLAGLATAVVKWAFYVLKRATKISEVKKQFDLDNPESKQIYTEGQIRQYERKVDEYKEELRRYNQEIQRRERYAQIDPSDRIVVGGGNEELVKPTEPVLEPLSAEEATANRRRAFVDYYKNSVSYRNSKVYTADYTKDTAVVDALTPRAKDNVGLVGIWIFQWPVVIVDTLFTELLIKLAKNTVKLLDAMFSHVSRKLVHNATDGL